MPVFIKKIRLTNHIRSYIFNKMEKPILVWNALNSDIYQLQFCLAQSVQQKSWKSVASTRCMTSLSRAHLHARIPLMIIRIERKSSTRKALVDLWTQMKLRIKVNLFCRKLSNNCIDSFILGQILISSRGILARSQYLAIQKFGNTQDTKTRWGWG
jgi:hypothetical protein